MNVLRTGRYKSAHGRTVETTISAPSSNAPFGALAPSIFQERVRNLARRMPNSFAGRKLVSLMLGPAGGRATRAFDVAVFSSQKARLNPADNICEKRVFISPQHWDPAERAELAAAISLHREDQFYFFDIGANAGLYSLFARAAAMKAGKGFRAACIEPDPEMCARAAFNFTASGADKDIEILPYAAAGEMGQLRFSVNTKSRGMSRLDEAGKLIIEARTIEALIEETAFPRIDAAKIDIEGHEFAALSRFLKMPRRICGRALQFSKLLTSASKRGPAACSKSAITG